MDKDEKIFGGFTRTELQEAFNRVKTPGNWKNPVDAVIDNHGLDAVEAALLFYAGSPATFQPAGDGRVHVTAAGYYACIGS